MKEIYKTIPYIIYLILGILIGATISILFIESQYRNQIEQINQELELERNQTVNISWKI